nr:hypothetical protein [Kribbella turkmenica]
MRLDRQKGGRILVTPLGQEPVSVGRLQALLDLIADEGELVHLVAAEQPLSTGAPDRHDLLIPIFPGTQRLCRQTEHASDCPDAVDTVVRVLVHSAPPSLNKTEPRYGQSST